MTGPEKKPVGARPPGQWSRFEWGMVIGFALLLLATAVVMALVWPTLQARS